MFRSVDNNLVQCKVCKSDSYFFSQARLLQKYNVEYYQCSSCGFVQTEDPYWLEEAYQNAIADSDVGLVYRNNMMANLASILLFNYFDHEAQFLDYGAGYGLFVRLMRDRGFDFYWQDKFCANIFAKGFEYEDCQRSEFILVTAFELFEHFVYPHQEIEKLLELVPNLLFSTQLLPENNPTPNDWWYYALHEGQHISIYTLAALEFIAEKYGRKLYSDGNSIHLFSNNENLPTNLFELIQDGKLTFPDKASLISQDFNRVLSLSLSMNEERTDKNSDNSGVYCLRSPLIVIDGVFFQLYQTGIARVWQSLLTVWSQMEFGRCLLVLDRANTAPIIEGINYRQIEAYSYNDIEKDRKYLQEICNQEGAHGFISTYYTIPVNTPSVFMAYDMIPEVLGADLTQPMWQAKHRAIAHASAFIAISENTARDLQRCFPKLEPDQITVAPCGVADSFRPATTDEIDQFTYVYGIDKPYFLLGSLGGYKNAILFFQAFARLSHKTDFDIVVTGPQPSLPADWRQYTQGCAVHCLTLADDELRLAYAGAIALVYPSIYEGFGMPVLEAMACGCPVITTANASLPEVAGEAALYVRDDDVEGMLAALQEVQKTSVRQELIEKGLAQARQFSWKAMAERVQEVLLNTFTAPLALGDANYLVFPDWQAEETALGTVLGDLLRGLSQRAPEEELYLLVEATGVGAEAAELFMADVVLSLMMLEDFVVSEKIQVIYLDGLMAAQWENLLPRVSAFIPLEYDDWVRMTAVGAHALKTLDLQSPMVKKVY
jgi:glycosyltransferase involved in cell wall biosynthesis